MKSAVQSVCASYRFAAHRAKEKFIELAYFDELSIPRSPLFKEPLAQ